MSLLSPIEKALTARFRGDTALMALLPGGFHSGSAPQGNARPYLVMGGWSELPANVLERRGSDTTFDLDTYSPAGVQTSKQVNDILDRVEVLLRTPLTLDDHYGARARKDLRTMLVEDDGTRHGLLRCRVITLETATA